MEELPEQRTPHRDLPLPASGPPAGPVPSCTWARTHTHTHTEACTHTYLYDIYCMARYSFPNMHTTVEESTVNPCVLISSIWDHQHLASLVSSVSLVRYYHHSHILEIYQCLQDADLIPSMLCGILCPSTLTTNLLGYTEWL